MTISNLSSDLIACARPGIVAARAPITEAVHSFLSERHVLVFCSSSMISLLPAPTFCSMMSSESLSFWRSSSDGLAIFDQSMDWYGSPSGIVFEAEADPFPPLGTGELANISKAKRWLGLKVRCHGPGGNHRWQGRVQPGCLPCCPRNDSRSIPASCSLRPD